MAGMPLRAALMGTNMAVSYQIQHKFVILFRHLPKGNADIQIQTTT